jgi:transcriptional regulator with XRE-family HTH domain
VTDRDDILRRLTDARGDARRIADQQRAWRAQVGELVELGRAAGLTVDEMAEALGLSKSWTERLRRRVRMRPSGPFFFPA